MSIDIMEQLCPAAEKSSKGARILIVDSDDASIDFLAKRLAKQGLQTTGAETARAALDVVRLEQPDLILLDTNLSDANGLEICRHLTDSPETCLIPVILFGDGDNPEIVRDARRAGARYFLRKPYDPSLLLLAIQDALKPSNEEW